MADPLRVVVVDDHPIVREALTRLFNAQDDMIVIGKASNGVEAVARRVNGNSSLPLAVGFGISTPEHVKHACTFADAAVVGSALVRVVADHGRDSDVAQRAGDYVRWLKSAL